MILFYKITGFIALMAGWPMIYYTQNWHYTALLWGYMLEKQNAKNSAK
jgi:hypothetical protein